MEVDVLNIMLIVGFESLPFFIVLSLLSEFEKLEKIKNIATIGVCLSLILMFLSFCWKLLILVSVKI